MKNLIKTICFTLLIITFGIACQEEIIKEVEVKGETIYDTLALPSVANNRIMKFDVITRDGYIYSSILEEEKVIKVYLPFYYKMDFIEPEIMISEGATVSPENGELVPVFSESPVTYTVTASDGDSSVYTLDPIIQQPEIFVAEDFTTPKPDYFTFYAGKPVTVVSVLIRGENLIPDNAVTKLQLLDDNDSIITEVPMHDTMDESDELLRFRHPVAETDTGLFKARLKVYSLTHDFENKVHVTYENPSTIRVRTDGCVPKGTEIEGSGLNMRGLTNILVEIGAEFVPLEIISYTLTTVKVKIPEDFPSTGGQYMANFQFEFSNGYSYTKFAESWICVE